jgi:hypothetical protein
MENCRAPGRVIAIALVSVARAACGHPIRIVLEIESLSQTVGSFDLSPFLRIRSRALRNDMINIKIIECQRPSAIGAHLLVREIKRVPLGAFRISLGHGSYVREITSSGEPFAIFQF